MAKRGLWSSSQESQKSSELEGFGARFNSPVSTKSRFYPCACITVDVDSSFCFSFYACCRGRGCLSNLESKYYATRVVGR